MIIKNNTPIVDLKDWRMRGGPKSAKQWAEGRSAIETARYWLAAVQPALPPEISALLASHPEFGPVEEWRAEPEVRLRFDSFGGETRNSDLVVQARDARGEFFMALEAKADEEFEGRRRGVGRVVLLVQEFVTTKTTDKKHRANGKDLDAFMRRLSAGAVREVAPGQLYGPIPLHSSPEMKDAPSHFIGKAVCNLRPLSAK